MPISHIDGQFALDGWATLDTDVDADESEFSDTRAPLEERARLYLKSGKFAVVDICRWDASSQEWELLDTLTKDDLDD